MLDAWTRTTTALLPILFERAGRKTRGCTDAGIELLKAVAADCGQQAGLGEAARSTTTSASPRCAG
jgi:hypothetical protein